MASPATVARWSALLDAQEASGQTLRAFATSRGVNPSTLSWWRWKLSRTGERRARRSPFLELVAKPPTPEPALVLELPSLGAQVHVTRDTDLQWLREVLEALC